MPGLWPRDAFQIQEAGVASDLLQVELSYGGGCRTHDVKGVAWGGWMESNPVQVRLFLSHEDFDDPCDAWITEDRRFDLGPLKKCLSGSLRFGAAGDHYPDPPLGRSPGGQPPRGPGVGVCVLSALPWRPASPPSRDAVPWVRSLTLKRRSPPAPTDPRPTGQSRSGSGRGFCIPRRAGARSGPGPRPEIAAGHDRKTHLRNRSSL